MATQIQLHHIGEVVLAGLLRELSERRNLDVPCRLHKDCRLADVITRSTLSPRLSFDSDIPLAPVVVNGEAVRFDGAHGVDVLCRGSDGLGLAFEAKLGLNRLRRGEFTRRFLDKLPSLTGHHPPRIKGSMIAILNHRAMQDGVELSLRAVGDEGVELARDWFLVIRRETWAFWERTPPALGRQTHVLVFEDIVDRFGVGPPFDDLVRIVVGHDFYRCWNLGRGG